MFAVSIGDTCNIDTFLLNQNSTHEIPYLYVVAPFRISCLTETLRPAKPPSKSVLCVCPLSPVSSPGQLSMFVCNGALPNVAQNPLRRGQSLKKMIPSIILEKLYFNGPIKELLLECHSNMLNILS